MASIPRGSKCVFGALNLLEWTFYHSMDTCSFCGLQYSYTCTWINICTIPMYTVSTIQKNSKTCSILSINVNGVASQTAWSNESSQPVLPILPWTLCLGEVSKLVYMCNLRRSLFSLLAWFSLACSLNKVQLNKKNMPGSVYIKFMEKFHFDCVWISFIKFTMILNSVYWTYICSFIYFSESFD